MKLPNGDRAFVDIVKLRDYCLNDDHPRGKHKAKVFRSALGLTMEHADELRVALVDAARIIDVLSGLADEFGQRYVLDFIFVGPTGQALVRSTWIIRKGEDYPRLTSCYVR